MLIVIGVIVVLVWVRPCLVCLGRICALAFAKALVGGPKSRDTDKILLVSANYGLKVTVKYIYSRVDSGENDECRTSLTWLHTIV